MEKFTAWTTEFNMCPMCELWSCGELGSLQNVRVKKLKSAFVSDVISWMEWSHLDFRLEDIVNLFMVCASVHQCLWFFLCAYQKVIWIYVCLPHVFFFIKAPAYIYFNTVHLCWRYCSRIRILCRSMYWSRVNWPGVCLFLTLLLFHCLRLTYGTKGNYLYQKLYPQTAFCLYCSFTTPSWSRWDKPGWLISSFLATWEV